MALKIDLFCESFRSFNSLDKAPIFWSALFHKSLMLTIFAKAPS